MTQYRGKYPTRIKSVSGLKGERGKVVVATNDGRRFHISAKDTGGVMPDVGQDIRSFQALEAIQGYWLTEKATGRTWFVAEEFFDPNNAHLVSGEHEARKGQRVAA